MESDDETADQGDNATNVKGKASAFLNKAKPTTDEEHSNTEAFEQKMQALICECKEGFKKYRNSGQKSMMEWITDSDKSDENWGIVNAMKVLADETGIRFSRMLLDFVFMMLNQEELAKNIDRFKSALKWVSEDGNSPVVDRVLTLLEMVGVELSEKKKSKEVSNEPLKGKSLALEKTELDESSQSESSAGRSRVVGLDHQFFAGEISRLFDKFLEVCLRLVAVVSHPSLPESNMSMTETLLMLEHDLKQCEEILEKVEEEIIIVETMFPLRLVLKDVKMMETRKLLASKINELWWGVQSLEEAKERSDLKIGATGLHTLRLRSGTGDVQASVEGVELQESRDTAVSVNQPEKEAKKQSKGNCCCS